MAEYEEVGRSDLANILQNSSNALGRIKSILRKSKIVEEFSAVLNDKKWLKLAKESKLAKMLILALRDVIEGR